ncbi:MAG: JAB domain-containing protein [Planctomycetota bacterium]
MRTHLDPPWQTLGPDPELLETPDWLAILLGAPRGDGGRRAAEILGRRDLVELSRLGTADLVEEFGLDPGAAARLVAAFALGSRVERERRPPRPPMHSAERVREEVWPRLRGLEQETFLVLLLDGKHRLRRAVRVSEGTLTTSLVHPREVFRAAVREAAAALIVAHNHPSGDPEPSREDLEVTQRLRDAATLLGIPLLDHVIVGENGFVSLRERMGF